jgi:hypothetical protein
LRPDQHWGGNQKRRALSDFLAWHAYEHYLPSTRRQQLSARWQLSVMLFKLAVMIAFYSAFITVALPKWETGEHTAQLLGTFFVRAK